MVLQLEYSVCSEFGKVKNSAFLPYQLFSKLIEPSNNFKRRDDKNEENERTRF